VLVETVALSEIPPDFAGTWQLVSLAEGEDHEVFQVVMPQTREEVLVTFSREGFLRLKNGLTKAGLDPRFFPWPPANEPDRSPYRGLQPLDDVDAGIYFGRDAQIVEAMDMLRGLRESSAPRIVSILGPSGVGKSSFLRAGIIPRLRRDDQNFIS